MKTIMDIGINHNGDIEIAKELIKWSAVYGADIVKFQKRTIEDVYDPYFLAMYRKSPAGTTEGEWKERLELGKRAYYIIDDECRRWGIAWTASAWDLKSQEFLWKYGLKYNKVASAMLRDERFLELVAYERKYTFISCGLGEPYIKRAVEIFEKYNCPYTLMHCVMKYPCPDELVDLGGIGALRYEYEVPVGYSCHSPSALVPVLAVAMGADAIEIHITLDRTMYGSDQSASFEPEGLRRVVRECHRTVQLMP